MKDIGGEPAIGILLHRLGKACRLDDVRVACSRNPADDPLARFVQNLGVSVFRGDEDDALRRFTECAALAKAKVVVRITADCPLIDGDIVNQVVSVFHDTNADYVSNGYKKSFPDGLDVEVFTRESLDLADRVVEDSFLREHVTPYIHGLRVGALPTGKFKCEPVVHAADFSHLRWTLDTADDLEFIRAIVARLGPDAGWMEILALLSREPTLTNLNAAHSSSESVTPDLTKSGHRPSFLQSDQLFKRATKTIPLASQTFSKSYLQWPRGAAPMFLTRGRGCRVWDVDDNCYIDHVLGLMPIILGYADPDVNAAVSKQINDGVTFSMPHRLEFEVAERLVRLIPCADMVRFGKNGSDATTAAIRLARAFTGKERIAICGYHGWHDWYIGTTSRNLGVPAAVMKLTESFVYNDADSLKNLISGDPDNFAAVILEPAGVAPLEPGFLEATRAICDQYGSLLIFDEMVCGFRVALGGASEAHNVSPDLACFGKAIANGFPLSAVVGRRSIMQKMEDIFFSGTFGGEAVSLAAAAATIDKLESKNVPARLAKRGGTLTHRTNAVFERHGLHEFMKFSGNAWLPRLNISNSPIDVDVLKSLVRQEFIANGILLGATFGLSLAHDDDATTEQTISLVERAAMTIRDVLNSKEPSKALTGATIRSVFQVRP